MVRFLPIVVLTFLLFSPFLALPAANSAPKIRSDKTQYFADEKINLVITGLRPFSSAIVRATTIDSAGATWSSRAEYRANILAVARPNNTLILSMTRDGSSDPSSDMFVPPTDWVITFSLEVDGQAVTSIQAHRALYNPNKISKQVLLGNSSAPRLYSEPIGVLYTPNAGGKHPAVLVLGGSEGGCQDRNAAFVASHGYVALALAYFDGSGTGSCTNFSNPNIGHSISQIPLEYFRNSIEWLKERSDVEPSKIAVLGGSRGGELTMVLASTFPSEFSAVVAFVPSSEAWQGEPAVYTPGLPIVSSWTLNSQDVPFLKFDPWRPPAPPYALRPLYEGTFDNPANATTVGTARIQVEKISAPVLLFAGEDDQVWASSVFTSIIENEMQSKSLKVSRFDYANAGHIMAEPGLPMPTLRVGPMLIGGTPEGNASAINDAWQRTWKFLKSSLSP